MPEARLRGVQQRNSSLPPTPYPLPPTRHPFYYPPSAIRLPVPVVNINNHAMYYEVLGHGEPVLCMGGWKELNGRYEAHSRPIDACIGFDSKSRLADARCPSVIIHAGKDVVAGKEQKVRFAATPFEWLAAN